MNPNPFGIPDFNALGDGNNPLLRSMDMMAQAWKNMASGGAGDLGSGMMPSLSPDDLDRRIRDLRAVESWLQLNLSMLSTTIQGLEIQRSTLAAIKTMAQQGTQAAGGKNPFEAFMAFNPMAAGAGGPAGADSAASNGSGRQASNGTATSPAAPSRCQARNSKRYSRPPVCSRTLNPLQAILPRKRGGACCNSNLMRWPMPRPRPCSRSKTTASKLLRPKRLGRKAKRPNPLRPALRPLLRPVRPLPPRR